MMRRASSSASSLSSRSSVRRTFAASGGQIARELARLCDHVASGLDQLVEDAEAVGFAAVDVFAAQHHVDGALDADQPRQALRAARTGNQAELKLRQPDATARAADPRVARHRQLQSASERETVDGRDGGLFSVLDQRQDRHERAAGSERRAAADGLQPRDVGARDERGFGTRDHHCHHPGVGMCRAEPLLETCQHGCREGIDRWIVDNQRGDLFGQLQAHGLLGVAHAASITRIRCTVQGSRPG